MCFIMGNNGRTVGSGHIQLWPDPVVVKTEPQFLFCTNHSRYLQDEHGVGTRLDGRCPCCSQTCRICRKMQRSEKRKAKSHISRTEAISLWETWRIHADVYQMVTSQEQEPPFDIFCESCSPESSPVEITREEFRDAKKDVERMAYEIKSREPDQYIHIERTLLEARSISPHRSRSRSRSRD